MLLGFYESMRESPQAVEFDKMSHQDSLRKHEQVGHHNLNFFKSITHWEWLPLRQPLVLHFDTRSQVSREDMTCDNIYFHSGEFADALQVPVTNAYS
jgi:hypothetical protein